MRAFIITLISTFGLLLPLSALGGSSGFDLTTPRTADFFSEVCLGNVPGMSCVNKFGYNPAVTSTEDVWEGGGPYTGHDPVAADTVHVFSSATTDDAVDVAVGAWTVQIFGLDANYDLQDETVILDGQVAVESAGSYIRVFRVIVLTAGTSGANAGTITVRPSAVGAGDAADVFSIMLIGRNQSLIGGYTIPNGKTGYLIEWYSSVAGNTSTNAVMELHTRPDGGVYNVKEIYSIRAAGSSHKRHLYTLPKGPFTAKTDMLVQVTATTAGSEISAGFSLLLVDD